MHTKLRPISVAAAKAHYDSGRTVHAVSPSHSPVRHMAHPVSKESSGGLPFEVAHKSAQGVMKSRTGSPALSYHEETPGTQTSDTDVSGDTTAIDGGGM